MGDRLNALFDEYLDRHKPRSKCPLTCQCMCHEIGMGHGKGVQCLGKIVWPNTWEGHYADWSVGTVE